MMMMIFESSCLLPIHHTWLRLHTVSLIAERQRKKLWIPIFIVFGSTLPEIEPESTISVAGYPLNNYIMNWSIKVHWFDVLAPIP